MKLLQRRWRGGLKTSSLLGSLEKQKSERRRFSGQLCVWSQSIFITDLVDGIDSVYILSVNLRI